MFRVSSVSKPLAVFTILLTLLLCACRFHFQKNSLYQRPWASDAAVKYKTLKEIMAELGHSFVDVLKVRGACGAALTSGAAVTA